MSNKRITASTGILPGLDGIRGIAIIGVLLYHLMPHLFPGGFLGVNLFFVLSGFLINRSLEKEYFKNGKINGINFLWRRISKLFPPLFWMIVIISAFLFIFQKQLLNNYLGESISGILFFNNWWQISQGSSYFMKFITPSTLTHLWYLSVQVQFYLIWVILFVVVKHISKKYKSNKAPTVYLVVTIISALLIGILFKPGSDPTRIYYGVDTRIFSFSFGALISLYVRDWKREFRKVNDDIKDSTENLHKEEEEQSYSRRKRKKVKTKLKPFGITSLILIIIMMIYTMDNSAFTFRGGMLLFTVLSGVLIFAVVNPRMLVSKVLDSSRILNWIGKRSYSMYLWHYPIIIIFQVMTKGKEINSVVGVIIQLGLTLILTAVSYYIFEKNYLMIPVYQFENISREVSKFKLTFLDKKKKRMISRVVFGVLTFSLILSVYSLGTYKGDNKVALDLQKKIEANKKVLTEKKTDDKSENKDIESIDGLTKEETKFANNLDVTFIGDSMLLMAVNPIEKIFPKAAVDGDVGRQLYQSNPVVETLKSEGRLKDIVVIVLGSNGSFTDAQFNSFTDAIGKDKEIYLVTTNAQTEWKQSVNDSFSEQSKENKNMHLIDWNKHLNNNVEWLEPDGTHPNATGANEMVKFIAKEIYKKADLSDNKKNDDTDKVKKEDNKKDNKEDKKSN